MPPITSPAYKLQRQAARLLRAACCAALFAPLAGCGSPAFACNDQVGLHPVHFSDSGCAAPTTTAGLNSPAPTPTRP